MYRACKASFREHLIILLKTQRNRQSKSSAIMEVILDEAGSDLAHVLKLTIFMTEMTGFDEINDAINAAFPVNPPARSSIAVPALPKGAKVVMEAIAAVLDSP